jgi:hypothetical protein
MIDFKKSFIVNFDALGNGVGVVLLKKEDPLPLKEVILREIMYSNPFMKRKCWPYYM